MIDAPAIALTATQQLGLNKLPIEIAQALLRLRDRVVARFPNEITHFILYGSFARGEAHAESDVDVMIVTTWPVKRSPNGQLESWEDNPHWVEIGDLAFEATLECGRFVSVYVLPQVIFDRVSDVAAEARREGIELFNAEGTAHTPAHTDRILHEEQENYNTDNFSDFNSPHAWLTLAIEELNVARDLAHLRYYDSTISKAYYAMLYAAKAALRSMDVKVKSHAGAISEFSKHFALTGRIDKSYGAMFAQASRERLHSDYEPFPRATQEKAEEAIRNAETFLAKAREIVAEETAKKK
jgi:uncharacterized protein (UPF0332 family)/predicted nucleotidyltransferase